MLARNIVLALDALVLSISHEQLLHACKSKSDIEVKHIHRSSHKALPNSLICDVSRETSDKSLLLSNGDF
jgi:hypothetical protein